MKSKFAKYSWTNGGYVIVKVLDQKGEQVKKFREDIMYFDENKKEQFAILVYGSKRKYKDSGKIFIFKNMEKIEPLDTNWVLNEHYVGLI